MTIQDEIKYVKVQLVSKSESRDRFTKLRGLMWEIKEGFYKSANFTQAEALAELKSYDRLIKSYTEELCDLHLRLQYLEQMLRQPVQFAEAIAV